MKFEKLNWYYDSDPPCKNGDIVVLVQYGEAEIAKYVSPKPIGTSKGGGNFVFEVCDNEDGLEKKVFKAIKKLYPEVKNQKDNPLLFSCPAEFSDQAHWE